MILARFACSGTKFCLKTFHTCVKQKIEETKCNIGEHLNPAQTIDSEWFIKDNTIRILRCVMCTLNS